MLVALQPRGSRNHLFLLGLRVPLYCCIDHSVSVCAAMASVGPSCLSKLPWVERQTPLVAWKGSMQDGWPNCDARGVVGGHFYSYILSFHISVASPVNGETKRRLARIKEIEGHLQVLKRRILSASQAVMAVTPHKGNVAPNLHTSLALLIACKLFPHFFPYPLNSRQKHQRRVKTTPRRTCHPQR